MCLFLLLLFLGSFCILPVCLLDALGPWVVSSFFLRYSAFYQSKKKKKKKDSQEF